MIQEELQVVEDWVQPLVQRLRPVLQQLTLELRAFADFLDKLAQEGQ